jgi:Flp pilus assembly protein TadG
VEFALTLPLFLVIVFTVIQFGLIFVWYFSTTQVARENARWLAVFPTSTDAQVANQIRSSLLPGMLGGTPTLVSTGSGTTPTVYRIGAVTARFPACQPPASGVGCSNTARQPGEMTYVELQYDARHIVFFPARLQIGAFSAGVPTALPTYRVWVMTE